MKGYNSNNPGMVIRRVLLYIILAVLSILALYPFIWTIASSFKTTGQFFNGNPLDIIPNPWRPENYKDVWKYVPMGRFLLNSAMITVFVSSMQVIIASMAAYAFSRLHFKGKNVVFILFLATMMVPGHVTLIPNYILLSKIHWLNKYQSLFIPPVFMGMCVTGMFLMRQYFLSIPKELEDAATIDGCSKFSIFWRIIMPNSRPAIATFSIISFKAQWNTFLWPLIVMNDVNKMPIQVGLSYLKTISIQSGGMLMAGTTISIIPVIAIFIIFQKYIINGTLSSGFGGR